MAKEARDEPRVVQAEPEVVTYAAIELIDGYAAFGYPKECVAAALRQAGVKRATVDEAKAIVEKFMRMVIK